MSMVKEVLGVLCNDSGNAEAEFHSIYTELVLATADQLDINIKHPRGTEHQITEKIMKPFVLRNSTKEQLAFLIWRT